jgi:small nuclear ribonucleoprotein (snRNP)-like protein
MQKLTISLAFIFGLVSSQLFVSSQLIADQVELKNGDRLTGNIIESDGKTLTMKSESVGEVQDSKFVGEVKIQWDAIQSITSSEPLYVTSKDGQVLTGKVTTTDDKFSVQTATSGEVAVTKDVVKSLRSEAAQVASKQSGALPSIRAWPSPAAIPKP